MSDKHIAVVSGGSSVRLVNEEEYLAAKKQERERESREGAKEAMIAVALMTAAIGGPYSAIPMPYIPKHGHSRHTAGSVYCHVCGNGGVTLYKDSQGYICRDCRKKEQILIKTSQNGGTL